jgi:hypothetical protein
MRLAVYATKAEKIVLTPLQHALWVALSRYALGTGPAITTPDEMAVRYYYCKPSHSLFVVFGNRGAEIKCTQKPKCLLAAIKRMRYEASSKRLRSAHQEERAHQYTPSTRPSTVNCGL